MGASHQKDHAVLKLLELSATLLFPTCEEAGVRLNNESCLCDETSIKTTKQQHLRASGLMNALTCQVEVHPNSMGTEVPVLRTLHAYSSGCTFISFKISFIIKW